MRKSKLDHPPIKQEVVKRLAVGEKPKSIAKDVGLSVSQIYRFGKREDIKPLIEQEQMRVLEGLPDVVENMISLVRGMGKAKDPGERRLCYEASREVLKIAGILPTATQSTFIQQVYRQQDDPILNPVFQSLIDEHNKKMMFDYKEPRGDKEEDGDE